MQKKIIALAVAGLVSGAAFAQSNVTVYGVADIGYNYATSDGNKYSGLQDGGDVGLQGSRIGFRGEEALGNGLKAIFTVEFGLNLSEGQGAGFNNHRQTFVGLSGKFGSVTLGRQYAPSGSWLGGTSSNSVTSVNISNYLIGQFRTLQTGNGSRWNNSIAYESPNYSGFQFRGIYAFHPDTQNQVRDSFGDASNDGSRLGLAVKYANGPLYLTAIYQAVLDDDAASTGMVGDGSNKAWAIGGSYDFKVVKLFANYIREKDDYWSFDLKKTYFSLGVGIPVSAAGSVQIEAAQYKTDIDETKSRGLSIGYQHALSKRTTVYTYLTRLSNQDNIGASINRNQAQVGANGENQTGFAVGLNHKF
ncbi:MAG: porin [Candidatus Accumulibacter sp.]|jgi:predicted porin|nr:porin [Accumulibacter sp.]